MTTSIGDWDWDAATGIVTWSAQCDDIFGTDLRHFSPSPAGILDLIHEDDRASARSAVLLATGSGQPLDCLARIRRPDGEIRWIEAVATASLRNRKVAHLAGILLDVTDRELANNRIQESEARYRKIVEVTQEGIWVIDAGGVTTFANERLADILGRGLTEIVGKPAASSINAADLLEEHFNILHDGRPHDIDLPIEKPDGTGVWASLRATPLFEDARYDGTIMVLTDITRRHQADVDLRHRSEQLAEAQEFARLGSWALDLSSGTLTGSEEFNRLIGVEDQGDVSSFDGLLDLVHPDDRHRAELFAQDLSTAVGPVGEEVRIITARGDERWLALRATPIADPSGRVSEIHGTIQDTSASKTAEAELAHLALHDKLTGLPNRSLFDDRLDHARARRDSAATVMLIDLDGFKAINDTLGHAAGDALLVAVAGRLSSALRASDTVARFGGDEFTVLVEESADDPAEEGNRLLEAIAPPVQLEGRSVSIRASVGIALATVATEPAAEVLRRADIAMYSAKRKGGGRCEVFSPLMDAAVADRAALERDLLRVKLGSEITLHYQPVVGLQDGQICGFEALLRWNHPTRGAIPSDEIVRIADACGAIAPIGRWVLLEACRQLSAWQRIHPHAPLSISVNLSTSQLRDPGLVADVDRALVHNSLDPSFLTLEVSKAMTITDAEEVRETISQLKRIGTRVSVNDVGAGYSLIGQRARFPIDELKIDRSTVAGLGGEPQDSGLVSGLIRLARGLHVEVVAEGIERVDQLAALRRAGCAKGQGYYLCEPVDSTTIHGLLRAGTRYPMPQSPRIILVVDDNEDVRVSTGRVLHKVGYEIRQAGTGSDALRIARETRLDAVILDVDLPDMDGFEISQKLGEMFHGDLPIIHLSGAAIGANDRVRGLDLGAGAYLTKPADPPELVAVLGALLRNRSSDAYA